MPPTRITVRNVAGMPHPGGYNPYRTQAIQAASWRALVATGADIIVAPESSGVNAPFAPPPGWRARPYSALSREAGSVIAVADHINADLGWRPDHPVLEAFTCYLDFAVVRAWDADVALAAVHVPTQWWGSLWEDAGLPGTAPVRGCRPAPSEVVVDALLEAMDGWDEAAMLGDFNEDPQFGDPAAAALFARARDAGYADAVGAVFGGPVRTNFCTGTVRPWQNDYALLSSAVAARLEQVAVFHEPAPGRSDHAGFTLTFTA